jgi:hypothetical protein
MHVKNFRIKSVRDGRFRFNFNHGTQKKMDVIGDNKICLQTNLHFELKPNTLTHLISNTNYTNKLLIAGSEVLTVVDTKSSILWGMPYSLAKLNFSDRRTCRMKQL